MEVPDERTNEHDASSWVSGRVELEQRRWWMSRMQPCLPRMAVAVEARVPRNFRFLHSCCQTRIRESPARRFTRRCVLPRACSMTSKSYGQRVAFATHIARPSSRFPKRPPARPAHESWKCTAMAFPAQSWHHA